MAYYVTLNRYQITTHTRLGARRFARRVLREIEFEARLRTKGPYSNGELARSIVSEIVEVPNGVSGRLGSPLRYASSVESGARVHNIFPVGITFYRFGEMGFFARPQLKFYWRKMGRTVWAAQIPMSYRKIGISHPGQKGKHFLAHSLRDVARRNHMRVVTFD